MRSMFDILAAAKHTEGIEMDKCEDDFRTRRGKFLNVEKEGNLYRETRANGEIIEYAPSKHPLEIGVEALAVHAISDVSLGAVRHLLTGSTREQFRAIGTEGSYKIFDVSIGSETPTGTILIRETYDYDGHALRSKMMIGLKEETITQFENSLPGILRFGGIEGQTFDNTEPSGEAVMLNHWRDHVVSDDGSEHVVAEWQLTFTTATLSPEGYSGWLPGLFHRPASKNERNVAGDIGIHYSGQHPLSKTIETLAANSEALAAYVKQLSKNVSYSLLAIAAALVYFALNRS
jgi:hypothetical protein